MMQRILAVLDVIPGTCPLGQAVKVLVRGVDPTYGVIPTHYAHLLD